MDHIATAIDELATATGFSGAVRVDLDGRTTLARAFGLADRGHHVQNTMSTRFGVASITKGFTALTVASLIDDGVLAFDTTARSLLGDDLPLIDDGVTVEQLLAHRSGIGDYLDEDAGGDVLDRAMTVHVDLLDDVERYLPMLVGHPSKFAPGAGFAYCNGGFVVLALLAQRASGVAFHQLVRQRVCEPAKLHDTAFTRSDELDGNTAIGYLHTGGLRTNVLHLPVTGSGDGGLYSTVDDLHRLWSAFMGGQIVSPDMVAKMLVPHTAPTATARGYGLGVWLQSSGALMLQGYDAGVSCATVHDRARQVTHTVISNTTEGAWPLYRCLNDLLST
ncbi:MAG: serine hydrolase domain-containing protein [Ilumatobacteraceae bacterium]